MKTLLKLLFTQPKVISNLFAHEIGSRAVQLIKDIEPEAFVGIAALEDLLAGRRDEITHELSEINKLAHNNALVDKEKLFIYETLHFSMFVPSRTNISPILILTSRYYLDIHPDKEAEVDFLFDHLYYLIFLKELFLERQTD